MSIVNIQQNPQNLLQHCESCGRTWEYTHTKTMCPSCIEKTKVISRIPQISRISRGSSTTVRVIQQTKVNGSEDSQFNKRFDELRNMLLKSRERRQ